MDPRARLPLAFLLLGALACSRAAGPPPAPPPPQVTYALPVEEEVVDYRDFTGRTIAIDTVVVRSRVTGYLEQVLFKEGAEVAAGDLLYQIDPRPYQAALSQAEGNVAAAEAEHQRLEADVRRSTKLLEESILSQEEFDRTSADLAAVTGRLQSLHAAVDSARLDLEFASIHAPIAGQTSISELDPGNLVVADVTALTSIVSVDPIHVQFDADERSVLLYRSLVAEKKVKSAREAEVPVSVGLSNEEGFPHEGMIEFVDNQLDASSGTIRVRAVIDNPSRNLSPGLFVRVRVPFSQPHQALLVDERALGADQRGWYLYIVGADGTVEHRAVKIGERRAGRVVISEGLAAGERVVVLGLQRARPGLKVDAREAEAAAAPAAQ